MGVTFPTCVPVAERGPPAANRRVSELLAQASSVIAIIIIAKRTT